MAWYLGEWLGGKKHNQGVYRYANGDVYEGDWIQNLKHGEGDYHHENGDVYMGPWIDDRMHGRGQYTCSNGECPIGIYLIYIQLHRLYHCADLWIVVDGLVGQVMCT